MGFVYCFGGKYIFLSLSCLVLCFGWVWFRVCVVLVVCVWVLFGLVWVWFAGLDCGSFCLMFCLGAFDLICAWCVVFGWDLGWLVGLGVALCLWVWIAGVCFFGWV